MLGVKSYDAAYMLACRARADEAIKAGKNAGPEYYNNLVCLLDYFFVHRLRNIEGKDGNPLNEVRTLADSLLWHGGVVTVEKSIKLKPAQSVLGHNPGDKVQLNEADFTRLADAYFEEMAAKFQG
jgi:hypothetical protein